MLVHTHGGRYVYLIFYSLVFLAIWGLCAQWIPIFMESQERDWERLVVMLLSKSNWYDLCLRSIESYSLDQYHLSLKLSLTITELRLVLPISSLSPFFWVSFWTLIMIICVLKRILHKKMSFSSNYKNHHSSLLLAAALSQNGRIAV